jgi:hypothetical protein
VSREEGLGISSKTSLRVIQPIFLDFNSPYSIKVDELLPLNISVYNYFNHSIPVGSKRN